MKNKINRLIRNIDENLFEYSYHEQIGVIREKIIQLTKNCKDKDIKVLITSSVMNQNELDILTDNLRNSFDNRETNKSDIRALPHNKISLLASTSVINSAQSIDLAGISDYCVLVEKQGVSKNSNIEYQINTIKELGVKIIGFIYVFEE